MEIHILRDGKQIGPFTEEATQALLKEGAVMIGDLACRPGDAAWQPLYAVLYPSASGGTESAPGGVLPPLPSTPPPIALAKAPATLSKTPVTPLPAAEPEPVAASTVRVSIPAKSKTPSGPANDPATPRQKAFLSYMGIPFPNDADKAQAAMLVNEAMESPKDPRRLQQWNVDRLRLHSDIFADEIKAKKDNRSQYYFEICQAEGAEFFEKVTKAHTQVLVGYLDVRFPNWDEREDDAKHSYFFPAIAEKFPQLLKKNARGKFKYPDGPKVSSELTRRSTVTARPQSSPSAAGAMFRGAFMGLIILGILYYAWATFMAPGAKSGGKTSMAAPTPLPAPLISAKPTPSLKPVPKIAAAPTPAKRDIPAESGKPKPEEPLVAANDDKMKPETTDTPPPTSEGAPGVNPAAVLLVSNPFEPLAPTAPIPVPVAPTAPPPPALTPSGRSSIKLTKPTVVQLKFGTSTLRPGTVLQIVAIEGAIVKVRYGPDVVPIPAANTDVNEDAPSP